MILFLALGASVTFSSCSSDDDREPTGGSISNEEVSSSEYVDLSLPSGTLWASRNLGASAIEENGSVLTLDEANHLGEGCSLPSKEQMQELYDSRYTTTAWKSLNGVYGRLFKSKKNGNSIFLPVTKHGGRNDFNGVGYYWGQSCILTSYSGNIHVATVANPSAESYCVRPVRMSTSR